MDKRVKNFAIAALRRASYRWPYRNLALKAAKVARGLYKCNICARQIKRKELQLDHIEPVVPVTGYTTLDDYATRLFVFAHGWQTICVHCHDFKTAEENKLRKGKKNVVKRSKNKRT